MGSSGSKMQKRLKKASGGAKKDAETTAKAAATSDVKGGEGEGAAKAAAAENETQRLTSGETAATTSSDDARVDVTESKAVEVVVAAVEPAGNRGEIDAGGEAPKSETEGQTIEISALVETVDVHVDYHARKRQLYVQFIPDIPYALTEFGAYIHSTAQDSHVLTDLDVTGLARKAGLMNDDVILAINNVERSVQKCSQAAILETLSDIGTKIGLVVKRRDPGSDEAKFLVFAFHLNISEDKRPTVTNIFQYTVGEGRFLLFPILAIVIPDLSSFPTSSVLKYNGKTEKHIVRATNDSFMHINEETATFVNTSWIVTMYEYEYTTSPPPSAGQPIAIGNICADTIADLEGASIPARRGLREECKDPYCLSGVQVGPVDVVNMPSYMIGSGELPENDMIFYLFKNPDDTYYIKRTESDSEVLYLSGGDSDNKVTLTTDPTGLDIYDPKKGGDCAPETN